MGKRFKILSYSEKYYEVVDNETNEMIERFSDGDPTTKFSARIARKQAFKFAADLEKKSAADKTCTEFLDLVLPKENKEAGH